MSMPKYKSWPLVAKILFWIGVALVAWFLVLVVAGAPAKADTGCPNYILVGDPVTGGSTMVDQCVDGAIASFEVEPVQVYTASSSYGECSTVTRKIWTRNSRGWRMFFVSLTKHWCFRNGKITYAPTTDATSGTSLFGSAIQWKNRGIQSKSTYNSGPIPGAYMSNSQVTYKYEQCATLPKIPCLFVIRSAFPQAKISARGDSSYDWTF